MEKGTWGLYRSGRGRLLRPISPGFNQGRKSLRECGHCVIDGWRRKTMSMWHCGAHLSAEERERRDTGLGFL
jgi:hypothetical protein